MAKSLETSARDRQKLAAPNPQGKGQIGFLLDWAYASPRKIEAKPAGRVLADYFTSLLVLSADFGFKPVYELDYYLYWENSRWNMSLLSPDDWNTTAKQAAYAGRCTLHRDATWSIEPNTAIDDGGPVALALQDSYEKFVERLDTDASLESGLPVFEGQLKYYQRLFAAGLGRSIHASLAKAGQLKAPGRAWLDQLPGHASRLLGHDS